MTNILISHPGNSATSSFSRYYIEVYPGVKKGRAFEEGRLIEKYKKRVFFHEKSFFRCEFTKWTNNADPVDFIILPTQYSYRDIPRRGYNIRQKTSNMIYNMYSMASSRRQKTLHKRCHEQKKTSRA